MCKILPRMSKQRVKYTKNGSLLLIMAGNVVCCVLVTVLMQSLVGQEQAWRHCLFVMINHSLWHCDSS